MKLIVVSDTGGGLGLAMHLTSEGHNVVLMAPEDKSIGEGLVPKQNNSTLPDIVIYDHDGFHEAAEELKERGLRVIGASRWSDTLEHNPDYAKSIIQSLGWETEGPEEGINYYITGWFNGANYISIYTSLVYRRFMSGGQGPDVNFTGVVSNFWQGRNPKIRKTFLDPLEKVLRRANHRGPFHAHAIISDNSFWVKEISASFNSPLSLLLYENSKLSTSDIILRLFNEDSQPITAIEQWATGILITVPPFPYEVESDPVALKGIQPANLKHMWLVDVMKQDSQYSSCGLHGKLGYITARGSSVSEATKRVYRTIKNLNIRDLQYRNDVGRDLRSLLASLKGYGWLR